VAGRLKKTAPAAKSNLERCWRASQPAAKGDMGHGLKKVGLPDPLPPSQPGGLEGW
jgi:hypothetical protein